MYYYIEVRGKSGEFSIVSDTYKNPSDALNFAETQISGSFEWRLVGYPYSFFD